MNRIINTLITLGILIALFLVIGLFLPKNYQIEQSVIIDKPVEIVYNKALDFSNRQEWDPWIQLDTNATVHFEVTEEGPGSLWKWKGDKIGSGQITVDSVIVNKRIKSKLEFFQPDTSTSTITWKFETIDKKTKTYWIMEGKWNGLIERWFGLIILNNIEKSFEQGLDNFKEYIENLEEQHSIKENQSSNSN